MSRTNSCQSDSSGFQEDSPEPLPLKNLPGSSDSIDSQVTLHGKSNSSDFPDISEEYEDFTASLLTENATTTSTNFQNGKDIYKSLSVNTETSDDIFQSFESHNGHAVNLKEMDKQISIPEDIENEIEEITNNVSYFQQGDPKDHEKQSQTPVSSEMEYPIYVTHYLSDIRKTTLESSREANDVPDFFGEYVSQPQVKSDSESNSFADDECSVVSSNLKWTSSPLSDSQSFSYHNQSPLESIDYSDHELYYCYQDKKSTFQSEINTNIYKSVTIQMSSNLLQDPGECVSRQHTMYSTNNTRNEVHALYTPVADRKNASSQTEVGWLNECFTNNHCSHQRSHFLAESCSFDTGLWGHHHSLHPPRNIACCHCCHCHHCCVSRCPSMCRHNIPNRPNSSYSNIEKELSDTLNLLRESLITITVGRDDDTENMKKACQMYREKLLEIEQRLLEQQAGCFDILTSEERENIRRLQLLRRDVLKEATELEFNLDERARHVREAISVQLEQVLEEQSRLYSELDFCDLEPEFKTERRGRSLYKSQSVPSSSTVNVSEEDSRIKTNSIETSTQKIDFSSILQNIKRTFRSFNN